MLWYKGTIVKLTSRVISVMFAHWYEVIGGPRASGNSNFILILRAMKHKTAPTLLKRKGLSRGVKGVEGAYTAPDRVPEERSLHPWKLTDPSFQLLFSNNPLPMYVFDRETLEFLEVNIAATQQYGYSRDEFLGLRASDIRPVEEVPRFLQAVREAGNALVSQGSWRHRTKDGRVIEVEVRTQGIPFAGRDAFLVVAQDVSARRKGEDQGAERHVYLQALLMNLPLAVIVMDTDRRIQMCNPAFEKLFGYSFPEIAGKLPESFLLPPDRFNESASFVARAMCGEMIRTATKRKRRDGTAIEVQIFVVPLIVNGERIGTVSMYEDIGDLSRATEAQRQAEERFRNLFENAVEGVFQTTAEGRYLSANPALARMYGYSSAAELIGKIQNIGRSL